MASSVTNDGVFIHGAVHRCICACGGTLQVVDDVIAPLSTQYAWAAMQHQKTDEHRAWADGPAFAAWQDQWDERTMRGKK